MTVRGTLALAVVFAALSSYLVLTEPPVSHVADPALRLSPSLAHATRVEIEDGSRTLRAERVATGWSPPVAGDLVETLQSMQVLTVIDPSPGTSKLFGLGDALRLRVLDDAQVLIALDVGATNPARTGVYVQRVGQPAVLLVGALLHWEIEKIRRVVSTTTLP